jgi:hypothetical protein
MKSRGWLREHTSNGLPDDEHFRGPEEDEDFQRQKSAEELWQKVTDEQRAGRQHQDAGPLCDRLPNHRPPGTVCP